MSATRPELAALLAAASNSPHGLAALPPAQCAAVLGFDGLTISLLNRSGLELVWHDPAAEDGTTVEDLQYTLGEGPTWDAARTGEAVIVPDVRTAPEDRWPALLPALRGHPTRAVFALPLHLGVIRLGALTGHRGTPGHPTRAQATDALAVAEAATVILITSDGTHDTGSALPLHRAVIHQAVGALTVRLDIRIDEALSRLRAYAFIHDRSILDVAHDVIHHHSRLDNPPG